MAENEWTLDDYLRNRQQAYTDYFDSPGGKVLLADLMKFCRANESTFHPDPRVSANLDGRREVWLRIQQHLQLDVTSLLKLYSGATGND